MLANSFANRPGIVNAAEQGDPAALQARLLESQREAQRFEYLAIVSWIFPRSKPGSCNWLALRSRCWPRSTR
jgi:hypothetical protein